MELSLLDLGLLLLTGVVAGGLGALLGIGGGLLVIPVLVLGFEIPMQVAVAASLVAVVTTSTATGAVYVGRGLTNLRLAMTLELATTLGAIAGGLTVALLSERALAAIFAGFTLLTAGLLFTRRSVGEARRARAVPGPPEAQEEPGRLAGSYVDDATGRRMDYRVRRLPVGLGLSLVAGNVSGLLGVGGGFLKVPAMSLGMGVPIRVAAATSNFMIGVTAAASLFVHYQRGFVRPLVAAPVALGVAVGALLGTRLAARVSGVFLARLLGVVLIAAAIQMALRSAGVWRAG